MNLYRLYCDEVGNHDMEHVDDPNQRFLGLTGVIVESTHMRQTILPEMNQLKSEFFQSDPDEPVIFHRKELVNKRPPFDVLLNIDTEQRFNSAVLDSLTRWDYRVITVVIDKKTHRDQYRVWRYHPYHYCLAVLLERFVLWLESIDSRGDVLVESRGGKEDLKLKDSYARLFREGTDFVDVVRWQTRLTSKELKVKPKYANIAGLQLADIIAHPSRLEVLAEAGLLQDDRQTFGKQICEVLRTGKYLRHPRTGEIRGYGKKLLP